MLKKIKANIITGLMLMHCYGSMTPPALAAGKIIYVRSGVTGGDGSSWTKALATVQGAFNSAVAGDQIWVAEGVYTGTVTVSSVGVGLYGGFGGSETLLNQRNWHLHPTIIDANHVEKTNVINVLSKAQVTIDGFTLRNAKFTAISLFGAGIMVNAGATVTAAHNIITGNSGPGILNSAGATILNNLIYANGNSGVEGNIGSNTFQTCINNTIVGNQGNGISAAGATTLSNVINNIVVFNKQVGLLAVNGSSHNCVFGNKTDFVQTPVSAGNIEQDPQFVNQTANDFHLLPTSPCIDQGTNDGVNTSDVDLDGQPRIVNNLADIGAFEWFSAMAVAAPAIVPNDGSVMLSSPVSISDVTPGAQIYFTTNGQTPSRTSTPYTASFAVSSPITIKAIAIKAGMTDSKVASVTYVAPILVRPGGPGTSGGHSWSTAFPTIAQALASASDGDQVWIAAGTYVEAPTVSKGIGLYGGFNGTETLLSQRNWHTNPTIISNNADHTNVVSVSAKNIAIDGFTIRNGKFTGIVQLGAGVYVLTNAMALISHNIITGNSGPGVINSGSATISNNLIYGNGDSGISSFADSTLEVVTNNTIVNNGNDGVASGPVAHTTIVNNVIAFNKATGLVILLGTDNCVFGNKTDFIPASNAAGNLEVDPLFLNAAGNDFHLKANSPCVNQGDDNAAALGTADLDDAPRVAGAHIDIGSYEYGGTQPPVNQPPTVQTPASAMPNPVTQTTAALSVLGADDNGEAALIYSWTATGPAPVVFSRTNSNSAKSSMATFSKVGAYTLRVTIKDASGLSVDSTVAVTVAPALTTINISPAAVTIAANTAKDFSAAAFDQFGGPMSASALTWSVDGGGTVSSAGHFASDGTIGTFHITAKSGAIVGSAVVVVSAQPGPTVTLTSPVDGSTARAPATITIQANASDANGIVSKVEFYSNGTLLSTDNASPWQFVWSNVAAGSYQIYAKATNNLGGVSVSPSVSITVVANSPPVFSPPPSADATSVAIGQVVAFHSQASDADGDALTYSWNFGDGATAVGANVTHAYTAAGQNIARVTVTDGIDATDATIVITVIQAAPSPNQPPTVQTPASATPNPVTQTTAALSVLGDDDQGEAALIYAWSATGPAPVVFSNTNSNSAKSTVATFSTAGSYTLRATIMDAGGLSVTSSVDVTVLGGNSKSPQSPSSDQGPFPSLVSVRGAALTLRFSTSGSGDGSIVVYARDGQNVKKVSFHASQSGEQTVDVPVDGMSSGVYLCYVKLNGGDVIAREKVVVVK